MKPKTGETGQSATATASQVPAKRRPGISQPWKAKGLDHELNGLQKECADLYIVFGSPIKAWRRAYRPDPTTWKDADFQAASQFFRRPRVARYIERLRYSQRHYDAVVRKFASQEARNLVLSRMNRVASWDENGLTLKPSNELEDGDAAAIQAVKMTRQTRTKKDGTTEVDESVSLKLADKNAALANLAKLEGFNREQQPAGIRFQVNVLNQYEKPEE